MFLYNRQLTFSFVLLSIYFGSTTAAIYNGIDEQSREPVIIDTDGEADDCGTIAAFIRYYQRLGRNPILCITTVRGVLTIEQATINVARTLNVTNSTNIPLYMGAENSTLPVDIKLTSVFGMDGLGDYFGPSTEGLQRPESLPAALALIKYASEATDGLNLILMGPTTNLELLIALRPDLLKKFTNIYIVGGTTKGEGKILPGREKRTYIDPIALENILRRTTPGQTTLLPLHLAIDATITREFWDNILDGNEFLRNFAVPILRIFFGSNNQHVTLISPMATFAAIFPRQMITAQAPRHVTVSSCGDTRGSVYVNYSVPATNPNCMVVDQLSSEHYKTLLKKVLY